MEDNISSNAAPSTYENAADITSSKETFRSQQSLGLITQKFMSLRQKNEVMNLNDVARELNIPKRRVYDVINVLEGLGYIQKVEKNNIQWIGDSSKSNCQEELEADVEKLRQQERILELMLKDAQSVLKVHLEDPISRPYNYIQKSDIRQSSAPDSKSIIIKSEVDASSSFEVQITDPITGDGAHEIIIRNKSGIKSHALLFTHETQPDQANKLPVLEQKPEHVTLASISSKSDMIGRVKSEDIDIDDLDTFVIPKCSMSSTSHYVPETPGRGLLISPFKTLIDPTCIMPPFCEDPGYTQISTASESQAERNEETSSVMELFDV